MIILWNNFRFIIFFSKGFFDVFSKNIVGGGRIARAILIICILVASSKAEETSWFIGGEIGFGGSEFRGKFTGYDDYDNPITETIKIRNTNFAIGLIAGQKNFFTQKLGVRIYANLAIQPTLQFTLINYGANADFLGNFYANETFEIGGFAGLSLGGNSWVANMSINASQLNTGSMTSSISGFDVALNIGLRASIGKYHGVELVARVPFIPTNIYDIEGFKVDYANTYRITFRYNYNFYTNDEAEKPTRKPKSKKIKRIKTPK